MPTESNEDPASTFKEMQKFTKSLESILLRRIHSFDKPDLVKLVFSYSQLMRQKKLEQGSTSVIKTLEYMIRAKWNEISDLNQQVRVVNSFLNMA